MSTKLDDLGDVLLLDELAGVLRASVRTIRRQIKAGTFPIPALPSMDRRRRWARSDVEHFLCRGERGRKWTK